METFLRTQHPEAQWFGSARLGLFVHWGISAVHGGIDLSWAMMQDTPWDTDPGHKLRPDAYFALAERFQPDRYDPALWLAAARDAGFRYAVLTARHHDGYALWPSAYGEFGTRTHMGGSDLARAFVEACRRNDLKVGLFYSPEDWYYNREYMTFRFAPGHGLPVGHQPPDMPTPPDWDQQFAAYARGQIEELLTLYGKIDLLWFSGDPNVISFERIRELQPAIVVNERMHGHGDFLTPEIHLPSEAPSGWWELADNWQVGAWGYTHPGDYKPLEWMLGRFNQVRRWGGNHLINVAPTPSGELPEQAYQRFAELGRWLRLHAAEIWTE